MKHEFCKICFHKRAEHDNLFGCDVCDCDAANRESEAFELMEEDEE